MDIFSRTENLIGKAAVETLIKKHVAVFGIGGVGGYVVEALARSGVGTLTLVDNDVVSPSNINRQIIALHSTLGQPKTQAMAARVKDINPAVNVYQCNEFFLPETADAFDFAAYDYVIDAIDTVSGKLALIERCKAAGTPIVSAMGAGNKLDATAFKVADISKTDGCPLARVMRRELKKRGIEKVKVVYSPEQPAGKQETSEIGKSVPASIAFVPSVMGLIIAGEVIKDLIK